MLEIVCVNDNGTKKLIKGQKYFAEALWEDNGWNNNKTPSIPHKGKFVHRRRIRVKGINDYFVDRFKPTDGSNFYDISVFGEKNRWKNDNIIKPNNKNYIGQYILCRYEGKSKYLKSGQIYYVEDHRSTPIVNNWGGTHIKHTFKLTGLRNYVSPFGFNEIPLKEQRKLKLQSIGGKEIISGLNKRKFLYYSDIEKKKILIQLFLDSIKNLENIKDLNGVTIVDLMVNSGKNYDVIEEDIKPLINKSLSKIAKELGFL